MGNDTKEACNKWCDMSCKFCLGLVVQSFAPTSKIKCAQAKAHWAGHYEVCASYDRKQLVSFAHRSLRLNFFLKFLNQWDVSINSSRILSFFVKSCKLLPFQLGTSFYWHISNKPPYDWHQCEAGFSVAFRLTSLQPSEQLVGVAKKSCRWFGR